MTTKTTKLSRRGVLTMAVAAAAGVVTPAAEASAQFSPLHQAAPTPVELFVPHYPQRMSNWCWVAVAQQIIAYSTGSAPSQCVLAGIASEVHPAQSCEQPGRFNRQGHISEIASLIGQFAMRPSHLAPPAHPIALYETLRARRPVILYLHNTIGGHFVVVRGMELVGNQWMVMVNDPMNYFSGLVPFTSLMGYWHAALVVG